MWRSLTWVLFFLLAVEAKKRYDGHKVVEITPRDAVEVEFLQKLQEDLELDFWLETGGPGTPCHIMAHEKRADDLMKTLKMLGMEHKIHRHDVQKFLDEAEEAIRARQQEWNQMQYDWDDFNDWQTIQDELEALVDDCPAGATCSLEHLGDSYEGRPMNALTITAGGDGGSFFLDATIHAREWLSTTTLMHIAQELVRNYGINAEATHLMDTYKWVILPTANPDGYVYTWEEDRLWRKSRLPNEDSICVGTDLNRNFAYYWGEEGASSSKCASTYHGASPANNPEVQHIMTKVRAMPDLKGYVNYHTYGQMFLHPWSHYVPGTTDCYEPDSSQDIKDANDVANAAAAAIEATHNTDWDPGVWCTVLYVSSGTSVDDTKVGTGVKYAYTPELRGNGFDPPPSEIQPAFEEMWNGLVAMVGAIEDIG